MRADAKRILPLTGVRVLDLTNVIAGPVATRVLGHLGAEIIKIELPWGRSVGNMAIFTSDKSQERSYNKNAGFNEVNRAKRSISLDLADPRGKALFEELVSVSDVVIENYSPRVMPNLGLTYGHLRTLRPDLIMVAMPALGSPGPWSNHISFGPGTEGLGGMCHVTGYQDGPPSKPGNFYSDQTSAFHVATAIMAAIWKRRRTGQGKQIEMVLRDVTMAVIGEYFLEYQLTGRSPTRIGNRHPSMAPTTSTGARATTPGLSSPSPPMPSSTASAMPPETLIGKLTTAFPLCRPDSKTRTPSTDLSKNGQVSAHPRRRCTISRPQGSGQAQS